MMANVVSLEPTDTGLFNEGSCYENGGKNPHAGGTADLIGITDLLLYNSWTCVLEGAGCSCEFYQPY
jgi:hypothetical protein